MDTLGQFLAEVNRGAHDDVLDLIRDTINQRIKQTKPFGRLTADDVRQAQADSEDGKARVVFNENVNPKYLKGQTAEVTKVNDKSVLIKLIDPSQRAMDRFGTSERIRCPLTIVDVL